MHEKSAKMYMSLVVFEKNSGSQAAFEITFRGIGGYLKARTSLLKSREGFSELEGVFVEENRTFIYNFHHK
jgi:hypothetical protein